MVPYITTTVRVSFTHAITNYIYFYLQYSNNNNNNKGLLQYLLFLIIPGVYFSPTILFFYIQTIRFYLLIWQETIIPFYIIINLKKFTVTLIMHIYYSLIII